MTWYPPLGKMLWVIRINGKTMEILRCWSSIEWNKIRTFISDMCVCVNVCHCMVCLFICSSNEITTKSQRQDGTIFQLIAYQIYKCRNNVLKINFFPPFCFVLSLNGLWHRINNTDILLISVNIIWKFSKFHVYQLAIKNF